MSSCINLSRSGSFKSQGIGSSSLPSFDPRCFPQLVPFQLIAKPDMVLNTTAIFCEREQHSTAFSPAFMLPGTTMQLTREHRILPFFPPGLVLHAGSYFSRRVCPHTKHNSIANVKKKMLQALDYSLSLFSSSSDAGKILFFFGVTSLHSCWLLFQLSAPRLKFSTLLNEERHLSILMFGVKLCNLKPVITLSKII